MNSIKKCMPVFLIVAIVFVLIGTIFATAPLTAHADPNLPFELVAPANLNLTKDNIGNSATTLGFSCTVSTEINEFFCGYYDSGDPQGYLLTKGVDYATEMWLLIQVDWALDDVNDEVSGWHYNQYWDAAPLGTLGQDENGVYHCSCWDILDYDANPVEMTKSIWVYRAMNERDWNGDETFTGVKSQLRPSQYTYHYYEDTDDAQVTIDYTKHTIYSRARYVVMLRNETEDGYLFSAWSEPVAYGKDAEKVEPLKKGDVPAPIISGLRAIPLEEEDFNGNPLVEFTLTVPDTVTTQAAQVAAANGTYRLEIEARRKGTKDWTELGNYDSAITTGKQKAALAALAEEGKVFPAGTEVELRARYFVSQSGQEDIYSAYSKIIGFGSDEIIDTPTNPVNGGNTDEGESGSILDVLPKSDCPICHFCPQPLGICIFIWIAIIVIILIVLFIVFKLLKKKRSDRDNK